MAKPTLLENNEGIKFLLSVNKGNNNLSSIIKDLDIKTKRNTKEINLKIKVITTNAITEKLTTLIEYGILNREGKNKGTKYSLNYEGIIRHIIKLIMVDIETYNSTTSTPAAAILPSILNNQKNVERLAKDEKIQKEIQSLLSKYFEKGGYPSINKMLRHITKYKGYTYNIKSKAHTPLEMFSLICFLHFVVLEDNPLINHFPKYDVKSLSL